jgi:hypothetical protein
MFNACELIPPNEDKTPAEQKHRAKAFTATREDIQQAIASCESKAERVRAGELGKTDEGEGVDIDDWANDLETAAAVLRELIGEIRPLDPGFMRPVDSQNTKHMELIRDLWWFIENVSETTPDRTDRFFALRERVRGMSQDLVSCPKCGKQIARKDAVTDQGTGEETGRTFTYCSEFCKETH